MIKIIDTLPQNYSHPDPFLGQSVNYFVNFEAEFYLLKIWCNESSFTKYRKC